jgi:hypothetical protein
MFRISADSLKTCTSCSISKHTITHIISPSPAPSDGFQKHVWTSPWWIRDCRNQCVHIDRMTLALNLTFVILESPIPPKRLIGRWNDRSVSLQKVAGMSHMARCEASDSCASSCRRCAWHPPLENSPPKLHIPRHHVWSKPHSCPTKKPCNLETLNFFILADRSFLNRKIPKTIPVSVLLLSWNQNQNQQHPWLMISPFEQKSKYTNYLKKPFGNGETSRLQSDLCLLLWGKNVTWLSMSESQGNRPKKPTLVGFHILFGQSQNKTQCGPLDFSESVWGSSMSHTLILQWVLGSSHQKKGADKLNSSWKDCQDIVGWYFSFL